MSESKKAFGQMLIQLRETAALKREALARQVGLNVSHIFRLETSGRHPSRETALKLARAFDLTGDKLNDWLVSAGFAPVPVPVLPGGTGRGGNWTPRLESMGLDEATLAPLMRSLETAAPEMIERVALAMRSTLKSLLTAVESPVRVAVVPAAGGQHRLIVPHVLQALLLGVIREAVDSGVWRVVLVLAPATVESLYKPLREALALSQVPSIELEWVEQARPEGLGAAVLQTEALVGPHPFCVLLPDDVVRERLGRSAQRRELRRMMEAFARLDGAHLLAAARVPRSKMPRCGVAVVATKEQLPQTFLIRQLAERPEYSHSICSRKGALGIVGRYVLQPEIFAALRALCAQDRRVELTDALERLRRKNAPIYAFALEAERQDVGEMLGQATELIEGAAPPKHGTPRVRKENSHA